MPIADIPASRPARNYAEAVKRFEELRRCDDRDVAPVGYSRFYSHLERRPLAVALLHGFTNCPEQYAQFAAQLHARGYNVVVPRLPGHGDRDRSGARLARTGMSDWLRTTQEAIDIACGAGDRVVVAGISLGGVLAAWVADWRSDVSRVLPIAPFFGLGELHLRGNAVLGHVLATLPNVQWPWDPFGDQSQIPPYAYPRFPTHGLGEILLLGTALVRNASTVPPAAREIVMITNSHDPAVSNALCDLAVTGWNAQRRDVASSYRFENLPENHDIVDPTNPLARVDVVYPKLIELIEGA